MDDTTITTSFISQYQAALAMFRSAVACIPPARWNDPVDRNRTWRVAFHALFFTHLYLSASEQTFVQWEHASSKLEADDCPFDLPDDAPVSPPDEMLRYADAIEAMLPELVPSRPYDGPAGFSWLKISRYEHHIRNIRHLQHHTGQLAERARSSGGEGTEWTGHGTSAIIIMPVVT